jgi:carbonic anhydrase
MLNHAAKLLTSVQRRIRWDLGARDLAREWKTLFTTNHLKADLNAGMAVACIAMPLSFAVAIASGVEPKLGLITAIIGGIVCAITGGVPLSVSGPTVTIAVVIAAAAESDGIEGVLFVGMICGVLQLLTGILNLGRLMRLVPAAVVTGFKAGVGAIIVIGQLPRALGLPPPAQSHVIEVLRHLKDLIGHLQPMVFILTLFSMWIMMRFPVLLPRIPAALAAVVLPTFVAWGLDLGVPILGEIPRTLPWPQLPSLPAEWPTLVAEGVIVYCLASLETLLSASVVDKLSGRTKHDPDQEMIGQGFGNLVTAMFGGIAVTGVIARSALNVQAGARTRRAALFHSLFLVAAVFFLDPLIARIPIAALAGVLLAVALRMIQPQEVWALWKRSRTDVLIYTVTFLGVVFADLLAGVQAGVAVAAVIALMRLSHSQLFVSTSGPSMPLRFSLEGPLSFLSVSTFDSVRDQVVTASPQRGVIFDLTAVTELDSSAAETLAEIVLELQKKSIPLALKGLPKNFQNRLTGLPGGSALEATFCTSESEAFDRVTSNGNNSVASRLSYGVDRFRQNFHSRYEPMFEKLAKQQNPHTLFITCADSRIIPNLITGSEPGDLFTLRNIGNFVPPYGADGTPAEGAAVEFAVGVLGVRNIVICGHSGCGAMKACIDKTPFENLPSIRSWLNGLREDMGPETLSMDPESACRRNIVNQLKNVASYPVVQEATRDGLRVWGWYYDMVKGEILEWSPKTLTFESPSRDEAAQLSRSTSR